MSAPLNDVGALNRRLVLEAPEESSDGAGGVTRGYATAASLWAQVLPLSAHAGVAADSLSAALQYRIVIRARPGITTRHRLREGTRVYRIISARERADRRFLEIDAEERRD